MDAQTIFLGSGIWIGVLIYLVKTFLEHRLNIDRSKQEEKRLLLQKRRESNTAVVDILTEWVHSAYTKSSTNEDRWRLQTTYWKNILLLDKELIDVLFPALACRTDSKGTNEIIVQARKILLGLNEPDIEAKQLNNWYPETETK
jgi:hypothetical protein